MGFVPSHIWPAIIAVSMGGAAAFSANIISMVMIRKINARLPSGERISYYWWGGEIRARFKRAFPNDKLVLLHDCCVVAMGLSFLALLRFWVFN